MKEHHSASEFLVTLHAYPIVCENEVRFAKARFALKV